MSTELATRPEVYSDYSPEFKAEALLALEVNGNSIRKTAKDLGLAESTLRYWIEQENERVREIREGRRGPLAEQFEHVSRVYIDRALEPDAVAKTSGYYAVIAASDAMKSAQLLRGQPTTITATVDNSKELLSAVQAIVNTEQISEYDAAIRLAEQLNDVPELASQLREWAENELRARESTDQS